MVTSFELAKKHLVFSLRLKLSCWQTLPLSLAGCAHHDPHIQRCCIQKVLQQYQEHPHPHPVVQHLLGPGPLREQMLQMLEDGAMDTPPELSVSLVRFKFAYTAERLIEGQHAVLKKALRLAPHHGSAYAAVRLLLPNIVADVRKSPAAIQRLADACGRVSTPESVIRHFGLTGHPALQATPKKRLPTSLVADIICHADPQTMFMPPPVHHRQGAAHDVTAEDLLSDEEAEEGDAGVDGNPNDVLDQEDFCSLLHSTGVAYLKDCCIPLKPPKDSFEVEMNICKH